MALVYTSIGTWEEEKSFDYSKDWNTRFYYLGGEGGLSWEEYQQIMRGESIEPEIVAYSQLEEAGWRWPWEPCPECPKPEDKENKTMQYALIGGAILIGGLALASAFKL